MAYDSPGLRTSLPSVSSSHSFVSLDETNSLATIVPSTERLAKVKSRLSAKACPTVVATRAPASARLARADGRRSCTGRSPEADCRKPVSIDFLAESYSATVARSVSVECQAGGREPAARGHVRTCNNGGGVAA